MADFGIHFFFCNLFICPITGLFLMAKRVLNDHLTSRMQFNLWFLLLGLLMVPFVPVRPAWSIDISLWLEKLKSFVSPGIDNAYAL